MPSITRVRKNENYFMNRDFFLLPFEYDKSSIKEKSKLKELISLTFTPQNFEEIETVT